MLTDPISDMLNRLRNAAMAGKPRVDVPHSKLKLRLAEILREQGFVGDLREVAPAGSPGKLIEIKLRYDPEHKPVIQGLKRVSKPGLRRYVRATDIPKVRNGLGVMILSTSKGVMTDRDARSQGVGGEALCAVW